MGGFNSDVVGVLKFLLPGFVTAWVFHGLTAHRKQSEFERVIQAIIFTTLVQFLTTSIRKVALLTGERWRPIGTWTDETGFAVSVMVALGLGVLFALCANNNQPHYMLAKLTKSRLTKRTTGPSEWFNTFNKNAVDIVLYLKDGRRVVGFPYEWPDYPDTGHFVLEDVVWVDEDDNRIPMRQAAFLLIPAGAVEMIEFLRSDTSSESSRQECERQPRTEPDQGTGQGDPDPHSKFGDPP